MGKRPYSTIDVIDCVDATQGRFLSRKYVVSQPPGTGDEQHRARVLFDAPNNEGKNSEAIRYLFQHL